MDGFMDMFYQRKQVFDASESIKTINTLSPMNAGDRPAQ